MSVPRNQEHLEAEQNQTNVKRQEFIDKLKPEDKAKFKAVEKAVNTLLKAKVPFFMFPVLPDFYKSEKNSAWQWNQTSFIENKFDKDGKPTEEFLKEVSLVNTAVVTSFFWAFEKALSGTTIEQKLAALPFFVKRCMDLRSDYLLEGEEPNKEKE